MLTVVHENDQSNDDSGRSLLDEIVRDGARQMLAAALQAEVAAYIDQFADHLDENGRRQVVRNGYHTERDVLTAAGAVNVKALRVNDKRIEPETGERQRVSSAILYRRQVRPARKDRPCVRSGPVRSTPLREDRLHAYVPFNTFAITSNGS